MLRFSHKRGVTEEGARCLLTLLWTGAEAIDEEIVQLESKEKGQNKKKKHLERKCVVYM